MSNEQERAFREMVRLSQELKLYDLPPEVCVTHKKFVPCRKEDGCIISADPEDVKAVREYHSQ